jgi:hypothetical protein
MNITLIMGTERRDIRWLSGMPLPRMGELFSIYDLEGFVALVHWISTDDLTPTVEISLRPVASMSTMPLADFVAAHHR